MERPRLNRSLETVVAPSGDLHLLWPSSENDLVVRQPTKEQCHLLAALDGTSPLALLEQRFGATAVSETFDQLRDLGLLEDATDDDRVPAPDRERYDRQLRTFSDFGPSAPTPSKCQERLRNAAVCVLGAGGLGGPVALALASCGVGELRLVDGDRVELSNLNRQTLYTPADIGQLKVEVAASRLRAFNPLIEIRGTVMRLASQREMADFISGSDLVVNTADWPAFEIERWCNAACFEAGIPYISMSQFSWVARVGPLFIPGKTGCYECQISSFRGEYPLFDLALEEAVIDSAVAATLGPGCGRVANEVAIEALHLLTGLAEPATTGAAHIYDLRTMKMRRQEVVGQENCPICATGSEASRPSQTPAA